MSDRKALMIGIVLGSLLLIVVCCILILGGGAFFVRGQITSTETTIFEETSPFRTSTPVVQESETPQVVEEAIDLDTQTLEILEQESVPENDPADLAVRLGGVEGVVPETYPDLDAPYSVGARKEFWVTDTNTNISTKRPAVLRYVTDHAYFWVGEEVEFRASDLEELAETFENHIYPTTREFFGSEWSPGIDGDPHIYILYVSNLGFSTAGYFSSGDSVHPLAHEHSNAHEMFVFNADNSPLDDPYTYGVLAHEFQHMIHWHLDRNEFTWVNEGFSELSTLLNGLDPGGFDYYYASNPDIQLTDWPHNSNLTIPHYGASFLFATYFLDRMGKQVTQQFLSHPANGLESIDQLFAELNTRDALTGELMTADDLVLDWVLTNYILDADVMDGRFIYSNYQAAPPIYETENIFNCQPGVEPRTVSQYGVDYIRLVCPGEHVLRFEGAQTTDLLPQSAHSGDFSFWSNKGDEADMILTREFDFSGVTGPLTFKYWTWYDIEEDYDYAYLLASTDGETWEILQTPSGTGDDPAGLSYGWAYNGKSGGDMRWIEETVDLSRFAGQRVWLRFEYVTDPAVFGEGMLLDDFSIPQIEYFSDLEDDDGGWEAQGFVRVSNQLPQTFRLALVTVEGSEKQVEYLSLPEDQVLELALQIGGEVDEVTLVVLGTTRYTRQPAAYQIDFLP